MCQPPSLNHTIVNRSGGVWEMGVISTNEWMKKDFNRPVQMMERVKSTFNNTLDAEHDLSSFIEAWHVFAESKNKTNMGRLKRK